MAVNVRSWDVDENTIAVHMVNTASTAESNVNKLDVSSLRGGTVSGIRLLSIDWSVSFDSVLLEWDHTTDGIMAILTGTGSRDYRRLKGLSDYQTGGTGDLLVTTSGLTGTYDIFVLLEVI